MKARRKTKSQHLDEHEKAGYANKLTDKALHKSLGTSAVKLSDDAMQYQEQIYRTLVESSSAALFVIQGTKYIYCNPVFEKITGYTMDDLVCMNFWDVIHPDHQKLVRHRGIGRMKGESPPSHYEMKILTKSGIEKWIDFSATVIELNNERAIAAAVYDITDRKRAEAALQQSEEKYRILAENASDIIWSLDMDLNFTYVSPSVERLQGWKVEERKLLRLEEVYTPASLEEVRKTFEEELALENLPGRDLSRTRTIETEQFRKDGSTIHQEITMRFLRDSRGKPVGIMGVSRDITERKRVEKELMESRQQLSDIIEFLPDATLVIDNEGKVIAWNRAMEEMTGVPAKEMLGKGNYEYAIPFYGERRPILIDLVLNPDEACERKYVDVRRKDKVLVGEAYMPALRGGEVYLLGTAGTLEDSQGNVIGAIESIHDITGRRKVEVALKQSEKRFRTLFDKSPYGISIARDGVTIHVNDAVLRAGGFDDMSEIIGRSQLDGVAPEARAYFADMITRQSRGEPVPGEYEIMGLKKDGTSFPLRAQAVEIQLNDGPAVVSFFEDLTERKKAEEERKKLETQLAQAQKMEAIGTLAGGIAHDFNNILTAMIGYSELAKVEENHETRVDCLNQVLKASERAKSLVKQILTFSRARETEKQPVQISPIIMEGVKLLRSSIPSTIEIHQEIETKHSVVLADPTQVHQVLMNLCTNAAHAMRDTGGILNVSLSHEHIDQERSFPSHRLQAGWYAKLTVRDTGHGIDPAIMDRIFEPFFTTKQLGEGTGLGMAVVYGIVKGYKGAIDIASKPGSGTKIDVYLPLAEFSGTESKESAEEVHGGLERVLLVDDEAMLVDLGERMLRSLGYQVTTRTSSIEALELFRARHGDFDLVITDMTMPNMTGAELAKRMLAIRPGMPIILCTGYSELMTEENAKTLGIRGYVMKPLTRKELGTVIHEALKPI